MNIKETQDYFDDNIDVIEIEVNENPLLDGLMAIHKANGGMVQFNFNMVNGERTVEVSLEENSVELADKLMSLGWAYEEGWWVYYE